jgi:hypothetical protein
MKRVKTAWMQVFSTVLFPHELKFALYNEPKQVYVWEKKIHLQTGSKTLVVIPT